MSRCESMFLLPDYVLFAVSKLTAIAMWRIQLSNLRLNSKVASELDLYENVCNYSSDETRKKSETINYS